MKKYYTISTASEGLYKEKGSKFLSFAFPVSSEEEIKRNLERVKKQYYDARHYCYAWMMGMDQQRWRANDDGEPTHSAGDPILGQIRSMELTNTLVIVVRYFGGTKLGVGGLINAYRTAAESALEAPTKIEIHEVLTVTLLFDYDSISVVEKLISDFEINVSDRIFEERCKVIGELKKIDLEHFNRSTQDFFQIEISIDQ